MKRREFLETGLTTAAGATAFVSGLAQLGCAAPETARQPGPDLAISVLDDHEAETLLKMSRQVYPHDHLDDSFYWKVVVDLDAEASTTPATLRLMREGIATLDGTAGEFIGLSSDSQVAALKKIESSEFFQKVRGTELVSLYNNPAVWEHFVYEGPSYRRGGYLTRGFNDLRWLPDPPEDAGPKPA